MPRQGGGEGDTRGEGVDGGVVHVVGQGDGDGGVVQIAACDSESDRQRAFFFEHHQGALVELGVSCGEVDDLCHHGPQGREEDDEDHRPAEPCRGSGVKHSWVLFFHLSFSINCKLYSS